MRLNHHVSTARALLTVGLAAVLTTGCTSTEDTGAEDPAAWDFNAVSVRKLAEASTDPALWDARGGTALVTKVADAAFQTIEQSMIDSVKGRAPDQSLFWGPAFAPNEQPTNARVTLGGPAPSSSKAARSWTPPSSS